jgi:hypothetical protein
MWRDFSQGLHVGCTQPRKIMPCLACMLHLERACMWVYPAPKTNALPAWCGVFYTSLPLACMFAYVPTGPLYRFCPGLQVGRVQACVNVCGCTCCFRVTWSHVPRLLVLWIRCVQACVHVCGCMCYACDNWKLWAVPSSPAWGTLVLAFVGAPGHVQGMEKGALVQV